MLLNQSWLCEQSSEVLNHTWWRQWDFQGRLNIQTVPTVSGHRGSLQRKPTLEYGWKVLFRVSFKQRRPCRIRAVSLSAIRQSGRISALENAPLVWFFFHMENWVDSQTYVHANDLVPESAGSECVIGLWVVVSGLSQAWFCLHLRTPAVVGCWAWSA